MKNNKRIIVIAPCYNEEEKITKVVHRIKTMNQLIVDEILVVDDGSTDQSAKAAKAQGATVISTGFVSGVGAALRMGFDYALEKNYDVIVIIAGNNKDEPNEIPLLIDEIVERDYDFVQGSRYLKKKNMGFMPFYRKIATRIHPLVFSLFTGKRVTESTNGFRAFKTRILKDPRMNLHQVWLNHYELEIYLYYKILILGYQTTEIPCTKIYPPKKAGYTKMKPFIGWWSILRPLFLLRFGLRH